MPLKQKLGVVVSDKMDKTIVVSIENRVTNKNYGKIVALDLNRVQCGLHFY